uniref:Scarecrow-like protein 8 n=2 Tax=Cajanus cajan TaxID=3821 RepID=A0A151T4I3_CAJCA|nr:Scarecrow-like protein 8 [Cajanus cajan]
MNNPNAAPSSATSNLHPLYRTQQNLPAMFLDPSSQIAQHQTPTFLGSKRSHTEFQTYNQTNNNHNHNHNHVLSNFLLRSVKPRTSFSHSSPLSPMDFPIPELQHQSQNQNPSVYHHQTPRFGVPLLHQLRPQPINLPNNGPGHMNGPNLGYRNSNLGLPQNRVNLSVPGPVHRSEPEKIMDHRLQELEKQLLEDNDEEGEADAASVITTSEWSETYQNLISPGPGPVQKPVPTTTSPTSSTTSSTSSSTSVASPASGCSKQTLMDAAYAIVEGKHDVAMEILNRFNGSLNRSDRLTDCMVSALKSRMNPVEYPPPVADLFAREHTESTQLLLENSVCFKVGFMAANLAILEAAFEEKTDNRFCVVDFEIGQGMQYMHLLSAVPAGATVKIVAVAEKGGEERVLAVGEMLSRHAERLRIGFEFKLIATQKLAELTRESLGCDADEVLAVNLAYKLNRIPDESVSTENPRDELLRRVKRLAPRVVTVVEQEMNANTAPFLVRVAETLSYYGALLESIDNNPDRVKVEEGLSRKLCNSVACEGRDRVERCEVFGKWRARMSMAGFQLKPLSQTIAESIKLQLASGNTRVNSALTVKEENGGICFGWMGRTLTVASAWR